MKIIVLVVLLALFSCPSFAALQPKGATKMQDTWNPCPEKDDILLPMPNDLSMVFRLVAVPVKGFFRNMKLRAGTETEEDRGFYDRPFFTELSAPFTKEDLPRSWQSFLPKDNREYRFYLIAKYEVSRMQWQAVMGNSTPGLKSEDALPMTDISWFDAVDFTQRYTSWLLKNHPNSLPSFVNDERNTGFIRLPTEIEWEYAARGGHKVNEVDLKTQEFFPFEEGKKIQDYAVFRAEGNSQIDDLKKIGSRQPNPLRLYDVAGNAAEMTLDQFRFSVSDRLLGSAGGFVLKGGAYLSSLEQIALGRREEAAFFLKKGPCKRHDTGFRPVLSGINIPGGDRLEKLTAEYKKSGQDKPIRPRQGGAIAASTPMAELDRIIQSEENPKIRKNLESLKNTLKDNNRIIQERAAEEIKNQIRTSLMFMEQVRSYIFRSHTMDHIIEETKKKDNLSQAAVRKYTAQVNEKRKKLDEGIMYIIFCYKSHIVDLVAQDPTDFDNAFKDIWAEYDKKTDIFSKRMLKHLAVLQKHYRTFEKQRKITSDLISKDIYSTND